MTQMEWNLSGILNSPWAYPYHGGLLDNHLNYLVKAAILTKILSLVRTTLKSKLCLPLFSSFLPLGVWSNCEDLLLIVS